MNREKMICAAVLLAALLLVPTMASAQSEVAAAGQQATEPSFFVEGYWGGGGSSLTQQNNTIAITGSYYAYVMGGGKIGYWFNPHGTYGPSSFPEWMKYFGVYTDLSFQSLNHPNNIVKSIGFPVTTGSSFGYLWTWSFMLSARVGFMPDNEVPFGRLQPYVAVGPGIFFSGQDFNIGGFTAGNRTSTDVGLVAEGGLRYFIARNISAQASFKYRYFAPSYYFSPFSGNIQPQTNLFSGQLGLAYHF